MRRSTRGFTLLELLIAATLMTMVALLGAMALRISLKTLNRGSAALTQNERKSFALYKLVSQLISIRPYTFQERGRSVLFFSGEKDAVEFISSSSLTAPGMPGLYRVKFFCNGGHLYEEEDRLLDDSNLRKELQGRKIELLKGIEDISLSYFDGLGENWAGSWQKDYLPLAVKIEGKIKGQTWSVVVPVLSGHKWNFQGEAS
jgi:prepilin-type N-terminal cleavage/methylation domain-containing protein